MCRDPNSTAVRSAAPKAEKVMTGHDRTQEAFHKNRERLSAERLAREMAELLKVKK